MKKNIYIIFVICCQIGFSCHNSGLPAQTKIALMPSESVPQILFLQIHVLQKATRYEAQITNRQIVEGILDRPLDGLQVFENQWLISFFDAKKKLLAQTTALNPLDEHFEVADDKGQFKAVDVKKNEADLFLRVQQNPKFASLQVEQILPAQKKKLLFSITF